jgi:hypothetical protein
MNRRADYNISTHGVGNLSGVDGGAMITKVVESSK